jgi:hypothetical protein
VDVLYPTAITDARLHSSTVVEINPADWNVGTTYSIGTKVTYSGRIYEALTSNTGQQPDTQPTHWRNLYAANPDVWSNSASYSPGDQVLRTQTHRIYEALDYPAVGQAPESRPDEWAIVGPTNAWGMFDNVLSTSTEATSAIEVVIRPGVFVTSLAMLGIVGGQVQVVQKDAPGGTIVYNQTRDVIDNQPIANWWEWIVSDFVITDEMVFNDLITYLNGEITVTITTNAQGNAAVNTLIFGRMYDLGSTEIGARIGIEDYSRKTTDDFGNATLVRRRFSKIVNVTSEIRNSELSGVTQILFELRATPVLWIPSMGDDFGSLTVFGFYRDFFVTVAYHTHSLVEFEIEGMT